MVENHLVQQLKIDRELLFEVLVVEELSAANSRNIFLAAILVQKYVAASIPVRNNHLARLKNITMIIAQTAARAKVAATDNSVEAFKQRAGWFVGLIHLLFRFEEVMTMLEQQLPSLTAKREELMKAGTSASSEQPKETPEDTATTPTTGTAETKPPEPQEPTLEQILQTNKGAFEAGFRQVFVGSHRLTKSPQEKNFEKHTALLKQQAGGLIGIDLSAKFIKELSKVTVPEIQDLLTRLVVPLRYIRRAKIELGAAKPETLAVFFGIPKEFQSQIIK